MLIIATQLSSIFKGFVNKDLNMKHRNGNGAPTFQYNLKWGVNTNAGKWRMRIAPKSSLFDEVYHKHSMIDHIQIYASENGFSIELAHNKYRDRAFPKQTGQRPPAPTGVGKLSQWMITKQREWFPVCEDSSNKSRTMITNGRLYEPDTDAISKDIRLFFTVFFQLEEFYIPSSLKQDIEEALNKLDDLLGVSHPAKTAPKEGRRYRP